MISPAVARFTVGILGTTNMYVVVTTKMNQHKHEFDVGDLTTWFVYVPKIFHHAMIHQFWRKVILLLFQGISFLYLSTCLPCKYIWSLFFYLFIVHLLIEHITYIIWCSNYRLIQKSTYMRKIASSNYIHTSRFFKCNI